VLKLAEIILLKNVRGYECERQLHILLFGEECTVVKILDIKDSKLGTRGGDDAIEEVLNDGNGGARQ